jgi:hypothetical protein
MKRVRAVTGAQSLPIASAPNEIARSDGELPGAPLGEPRSCSGQPSRHETDVEAERLPVLLAQSSLFAHLEAKTNGEQKILTLPCGMIKPDP